MDWFFHLINNEKEGKKGLFCNDMSFYSNEKYRTNPLIVCKKINNDKTLTFALFDDYNHFHRQLKKEKEYNFYEVILGEYKQKPHFDIDIKSDEIEKLRNNNVDVEQYCEELINNLVDNIIKVFKDYKVELNIENDLLIYNSHGKDKRSFHVIINNWCHSNNNDAKCFYKLVLSGMDDKHKKFIDIAVYGPKQQFRMLGSQKAGSNRIKKLMRNFKYNGIEYEHKSLRIKDTYELIEDENDFECIVCENVNESIEVSDLRESLISYIRDCKTLPNFNFEEKKEIEDVKITSEIEEKCFNLLYEKYGNILPFNYSGMTKNTFNFSNKHGYKCIQCDRFHDGQNPYMFISREGVFFNCRRNEKSLFLGTLNGKNRKWKKRNIVQHYNIYSGLTESIKKPKKNEIPKANLSYHNKNNYNFLSSDIIISKDEMIKKNTIKEKEKYKNPYSFLTKDI